MMMVWTPVLLLVSIVHAITTEEKQAILHQHNIYRCIHEVPDFTWDDAAAAGAQSWADQGEHKHSSRTSRGENCGENIAWGTMSAEQVARNWYSEIKHTVPYGRASYPPTSTGHYTQLVWKGSVKVGCGKGAGNYWVCRYCPAGNFGRDQFSQQVLPPTKSVTACGGTDADVPAGFTLQPATPQTAVAPAVVPAPVVTPAPVDAAGLAVAPALGVTPALAPTQEAAQVDAAGLAIASATAPTGEKAPVLSDQGGQLAGGGILPGQGVVEVAPAAMVGPGGSMPNDVDDANNLAMTTLERGIARNFRQEQKVTLDSPWVSTWCPGGATTMAFVSVVFLVGMMQWRGPRVVSVQSNEVADEEVCLTKI